MNSYNKLIHILVLITDLYLFRSLVGHILVLIADLYLFISPVGHMLRLFRMLKLFPRVGTKVVKHYITVGVHKSFPQGVVS